MRRAARALARRGRGPGSCRPAAEPGPRTEPFVRARRCGLSRALRAALLASSALIAVAVPAAAQDATWLLNATVANPVAGTFDFNADANWTNPATVPTGTASFGTSNTPNLSFSSPTTIGGWTFNAGASSYSFTNTTQVQFDGAGIVINGGSATIANNFVMEFFGTDGRQRHASHQQRSHAILRHQRGRQRHHQQQQFAGLLGHQHGRQRHRRQQQPPGILQHQHGRQRHHHQQR